MMLEIFDPNGFCFHKHNLSIRTDGKDVLGVTRKDISNFHAGSPSVVAQIPLLLHRDRINESYFRVLCETDLESTNHLSPSSLVILHYENGYQDWYPGWELHPRLLYRRGGTSYGLTYCREVFFYKTDEVGLSRIRTYTLRPSRARDSCSLLVKALSG